MFRIGHGYDVHRFAENRALILGGVTVPYEKGLLGHSDADVLLHAISDALLGAAALGDIGKHFPDTDDRYKGADSLVLDFSKLDYISSAGLRVLLSAHKAMITKGGMKVTHVNEIVQEVFEVTGFTDVLTIEA